MDHTDKSSVEELLGAPANGTTTAKENLEPAASRSADLLEHDCVGETGQAGDAVLRCRLLGGNGPIKDRLLQCATRLHLGEDTLADQLPNSRHTDEDRLY